MKEIFAAALLLVANIALSLVVALLVAGVAYYGLQFAHAQDEQIPTFSYWALYWLIFVIRAILPSNSGSSAEK